MLILRYIVNSSSNVFASEDRTITKKSGSEPSLFCFCAGLNEEC